MGNHLSACNSGRLQFWVPAIDLQHFCVALYMQFFVLILTSVMHRSDEISFVLLHIRYAMHLAPNHCCPSQTVTAGY